MLLGRHGRLLPLELFLLLLKRELLSLDQLELLDALALRALELQQKKISNQQTVQIEPLKAAAAPRAHLCDLPLQLMSSQPALGLPPLGQVPLPPRQPVPLPPALIQLLPHITEQAVHALDAHGPGGVLPRATARAGAGATEPRRVVRGREERVDLLELCEPGCERRVGRRIRWGVLARVTRAIGLVRACGGGPRGRVDDRVGQDHERVARARVARRPVACRVARAPRQATRLERSALLELTARHGERRARRAPHRRRQARRTSRVGVRVRARH